jgi:DNA-binding NarL/FixJ family response regulator
VIRVLVVDDHQVVREGLRFVLEQECDIEVVGEAGDGRAALGAIRDLAPDVVLLDMMMPVLDGKGVLDSLRHEDSGPAVVVLTSYPGDEEAIAAVRAGALSYLPKSAAIDRVTDAVRAAAAGGSVLEPGVTAVLVNQLRRQEGAGPVVRSGARRARGVVPRAVQPGGSPGFVARRADREVVRLQHPHQAGPEGPDPSRDLRPSAGPGAARRRPPFDR